MATALVAALLLPEANPGQGAALRVPESVATLKNQAGATVGTVTFRDVGGGRTHVRASVTGLAPASDFHGFHLHANGDCTGDFVASAGGHWNPGGGDHGDHAGDMPVLYADPGGSATASYTTDAFTVAQLLADPGGVAVIVHAGRDNYANIPTRYTVGGTPGPDATTKGNGDAGGRYACGVAGTGATTAPTGYWVAAGDGGVFAHGTAAFHGSQGGTPLNQPIVAMAPTPGGGGYYLAASDGGIFTHGDASFQGSAGSLPLNSPVVDVAVPPLPVRALLRNQAGAQLGHVGFTQEGGRVRVTAHLTGLAPFSDFHGFHVHANGECAGDFTSAGGHWNPGASTHGDHAGDMPVLYADAAGTVRASYTLDAFTAADLLADPGGVAVIVHAGRDNYGNIPTRYESGGVPGPDATTNSTGDAGARFACGVVSAAGGSARAGYWLAAADGGIFAYGDAPFLGSLGATPLNRPIVGMAATPSGNGYWLVASDGGIFSYGDAPFLGSLGGITLNRPIMAMAATPSGRGYVLFGEDGGVFAFGDAPYVGDISEICYCGGLAGADLTESGYGYVIVGRDGGIVSFGDAGFVGTVGTIPLNSRVVDAALKR